MQNIPWLDANDKYGKLLTSDIKIFRKYFDEAVKLLGIQVVYYAPRPGKHYTTYTEIKENFQSPEVVGVMFEDHPNQKSMKAMGWISELQESASLIHVPYDLHDIQKGALFAIPSGLDKATGRLFRVEELQNGMIYPASITCLIVPEYEDVLPNSKMDVHNTNFNLLADDGEDDWMHGDQPLEGGVL